MPVVRTEHLPYVVTNEEQKAEHRQGIGLIDRMVFVSRAAADTFRHAGFSGERTAIVRNGIEMPEPSTPARETRQQLNCRLVRRWSSRSRGLPRRRTMGPCSTRPGGLSGSLMAFASSWSEMVQSGPRCRNRLLQASWETR